jgi:hypothetical protein
MGGKRTLAPTSSPVPSAQPKRQHTECYTSTVEALERENPKEHGLASAIESNSNASLVEVGKGRYRVELGNHSKFVLVGVVADHDLPIKKEVRW